ncbi:hypothetical protein CCR75_008715 [Bremia lactucae]|uniref:Uncharacterized protein n=1 Tax=Bremia lactucae TaxID=4779 RepID=A0A976IK78_BRELC|nr:hypothetical protein CCR75_008715 [Bremia lactucae]
MHDCTSSNEGELQEPVAFRLDVQWHEFRDLSHLGGGVSAYSVTNARHRIVGFLLATHVLRRPVTGTPADFLKTEGKPVKC